MTQQDRAHAVHEGDADSEANAEDIDDVGAVSFSLQMNKTISKQKQHTEGHLVRVVLPC